MTESVSVKKVSLGRAHDDCLKLTSISRDGVWKICLDEILCILYHRSTLRGDGRRERHASLEHTREDTHARPCRAVHGVHADFHRQLLTIEHLSHESFGLCHLSLRRLAELFQV